MQASFRAYIDESGDEGFAFRKSPAEQASTDWFVLAAFVTRKAKDIETVRVIDQVRSELKRPPKKHLHWIYLKHAQKVRYAQIIAGLQARVIAVCVHKPSLLEPETFQQGYRLYFYAVRYLIERISWLARDRHDSAKWGGDGTAELVFSNRSGMPYDQMREYLQRLEEQKRAGWDIQIEFDKVRIDKLEIQTPGRCMGLQLADAVAGAFFNALERDRFGNTEPRYVRTVLPVVYQREKKYFGYGIKIMPIEVLSNVRREAHLGWLAEMKTADPRA